MLPSPFLNSAPLRRAATISHEKGQVGSVGGGYFQGRLSRHHAQYQGKHCPVFMRAHGGCGGWMNHPGRTTIPAQRLAWTRQADAWSRRSRMGQERTYRRRLAQYSASSAWRSSTAASPPSSG